MKSLILSVLFLILSTSFAYASETFTVEEVADHNTTDDCYMIFEDEVYDLTDYLDEHDRRYYDIDAWCGEDMTEAFVTKDGKDEDHRSSSYALLEEYCIGDLVTTSTDDGLEEDTVEEENLDELLIEEEVEDVPFGIDGDYTPYNFPVPFGLTLIIYFISKLFIDSKKLKFIWNTLLLISLIPSLAFGIFLIIRYNFPDLFDIDFDFLFWHVEGSVVFGAIVLIHFIERIKVYIAQSKLFRSH